MSLPIHIEEEYTDYSCSTALERLSRDVETILRAWHVDKGSDRHVSLAGITESASSLFDDPTCPLIRSNTLAWTVPVTTRQGRVSVTVDLELALWDEPGSKAGTLAVTMEDTDAPLTETSTMTEQHSAQSPLVKSLQRGPFGVMPSHDYLFDNFARLFGIGQHISLSPIHPDPLPVDLVEFVGMSVLERHDDQATAPFVFGATLSGWLQTALNCATANAQCAIPAFGVWGVYRPNELIPVPRQIPSRRSSAGMLTVGGSTAPTTKTTTSSHNGDVTHLSMHSGQSHSDHLLGKTIQTKDIPTSPLNSPPRPPPRGIPVFPRWAQALRQASLPAVARSYKRRAVHWNSHFVPPLVCGRVTGNIAGTPIDAPSTAATMWVSATTYLPGHEKGDLHHALAASSRLSIWASVLLSHCPNDTMCVLLGARHVFGWFKPSPDEIPKNMLFGKSNAEFLASLQEWRFMNTALISTPRPDDTEFELYRKHCQAHAMDLLEDAWSRNKATRNRYTSDDYYEYKQHQQMSSLRPPVWGPVDDPVASVYATTTWSGATNTQGVVEPLLTFPLRIRSSRPVSKRDWLEMEESVERTILDPLSPSRFVVQVYYDRDTSVATLAANQRCVLAALIRSATLPGETLLSHLTNVELVSLWDDDAGTVVATKLASKSKVGKATQQIVQAMDWSSIMEDMITLREAEEIVHSVMKGEVVAGFPSSLKEAFLDENDIAILFARPDPREDCNASASTATANQDI